MKRLLLLVPWLASAEVLQEFSFLPFICVHLWRKLIPKLGGAWWIIFVCGKE
jgi:hypothetical protein